MARADSPSAPDTPPVRSSLLKDILRGSGLYSLTLIGQRIASIILIPVYTRYLTPADYGTLDLIDQAVAMTAVLFGSNFSAALFYFFFQRTERDWRNQVSSTNILGSALAGGLTMIVGLLLASQISAFVFQTAAMAYYFRVLFVTTGISFVAEALLCWLRAENLPHLYAGFSLARVALVLVCSTLFLTVFHWTIAGVLYSNLIGTVMLTAILGLYTFRRIGLSFDVALVRDMIRYSFPLAFTGTALFVMHFADRFILQRNVSLGEVGIYSLAYKLGMMITFVHSSFHTYWSSQVYEVLRRDDGEELFGRIFTYMTVLLSFCALGIVVTIKPALALLTTAQFQGAGHVVPIIVFAYYIRALGDYFRLLFAVHKRLSWDAVCNWIGASVCVGSYFLLIPRYGVTGAAVATAITFTSVAAVSYVAGGRLMPIRLEPRLLKVFAVSGLLTAIQLVTPVNSFWSQLLLAVVLLLLFPVLLRSSGFLSEPELVRGRLLLQTVQAKVKGGNRA